MCVAICRVKNVNIYRTERRERKLYVFAQNTEAVYIKENKFS